MSTFVRLHGDAKNDPEFTVVRLAPGADPAVVLERNRGGFADALNSRTTWFTGAKPAELRQLDAAMPYLRGTLAFALFALLAVLMHALWTRARMNRHDLAVLRALGSTRRQLDGVTAWQVAPFALAIVAVGLPIGILFGRRLFTALRTLTRGRG